MPITTNHRPYSQSNLHVPNSPWVLFTPHTPGLFSIKFEVQDQPVVIVAAKLGSMDAIALQVTPDGGTTWADFIFHDVPIQLSGTNVLIMLRIPGFYRLRKLHPYTGVTVTAQPVTMTHEPRVPLTLPASGAMGPQGPQGPQGPSGGDVWYPRLDALEARVRALESK